MESIALKEWAVVCEALERGRQSIIVRKGGIAEGREGFHFRHREFFLFPTWFHEQPEKVRESDIKFPEPTPDMIRIGLFARIEVATTIDSWKAAQLLGPLHILKPEVIRERFEYDSSPGLNVALLRVFRVVPIWTIADEKKYGGCRSWVSLPKPAGDLRFEPVLTDSAQAARHDEFAQLLGSTRSELSASD
jgi:hypothetical protein